MNASENALKKKLKSRRGASSIIALLFFVVAMMVGAVVLSAAGTNAGRASHALKDQQEYYAVESALKLLNGELENSQVVVSDPVNLETESRTVTFSDNARILKLFENEIMNHFNPAKETGEEKSETKTLTVTTGGTDSGVPEVTAEITLNFNSDDEMSGAPLTEEPTEDMSFEISLFAGKSTASNLVIMKYAPVMKNVRVYVYEDSREVKGYQDQTTVFWYQQSVERSKEA